MGLIKVLLKSLLIDHLANSVNKNNSSAGPLSSTSAGGRPPTGKKRGETGETRLRATWRWTWRRTRATGTSERPRIRRKSDNPPFSPDRSPASPNASSLQLELHRRPQRHKRPTWGCPGRGRRGPRRGRPPRRGPSRGRFRGPSRGQCRGARGVRRGKTNDSLVIHLYVMKLWRMKAYTGVEQNDGVLTLFQVPSCMMCSPMNYLHSEDATYSLMTTLPPWQP